MRALATAEGGDPLAALKWPKKFLAAQPKALREKVDLYDIPFLPFAPVFDRVILYRLSQEDRQREQRTAGGLIVPDSVVKQADPRAVLLRGGLMALDYFESHNIEIGDTVWPARFSGWEPEVLPRRPGEADTKQMLFVLAQDLTGSIEGLQREIDGEVEIYLDKTGRHRYRRRGKPIEAITDRHDVNERSV